MVKNKKKQRWFNQKKKFKIKRFSEMKNDVWELIN